MAASPNIIINRERASCVLHFTATTGPIVIVGDTSTSNIAKDDETVVGAHISQIITGSPSGAGAYWKITRGANTVAVVDSTATLDLAGSGMPINLYPTATLSVELIGATDGFLMIELQKTGSEYQYLAS